MFCCWRSATASQDRPTSEDFFPLLSTRAWGGRATRAEVSLDAIVENTRKLARVAGRSSLMAVVKGDGYGHGAVQVARAALENGASWLGVYTVEEGLILRRASIGAPILVFGPFEAPEAVPIVQKGLTPTLLDLSSAEALQRASAGQRVRFHLKIDTGLNRAGMAVSDTLHFLQALRAYGALEPQGIYTHFASADIPACNTTTEQLAIFLSLIESLESGGFYFSLKHAANSAATLGWPETRLNLVRTGIALYGYPPVAGACDGRLRPALSLVSKIARLHHVPAGTGIGYGHDHRCRRATLVALVPIGYGDGLPRSLGGSRGSVLVRGIPVPILGRVSMDQITVDVTDVPEAAVGDTVTLVGRSGPVAQGAEELASDAGTISYEILTGLLPRVPRLYAKERSIVESPALLEPE